jgi:predicted transcriptional regulator
MADIESHTIRLLQELREEMRQSFARTETNFTRLEAKINDGFEHLSEEIEEVRRAFAGESVLGRMAAKNVDDRLAELERRIAAIESQSLRS